MDKEKTMNAQDKSAATQISIRQIHPFRNHPFKVLDDDRMKDLVQSIKDNGILNPVLVRPDEQDGFEMISGHRRMHAAKLASSRWLTPICSGRRSFRVSGHFP